MSRGFGKEYAPYSPRTLDLMLPDTACTDEAGVCVPHKKFPRFVFVLWRKSAIHVPPQPAGTILFVVLTTSC
jgi:7,8-dihydro-6-hydroxymethylpterin-pyrophosphokinase